MAAATVGRKRSFFEDFQSSPFPTPKKLSCFPSLPPPPLPITSCRKTSFFEEDSELPVSKKLRYNGGFLGEDEASNPSNRMPANRAAWVELLVKEMMSVTSIDDAKSRAAKLFENFEKSVATGARADAEASARSVEEKMQEIEKENSVLKRGVAIQHQRLKELEDRNQEVMQLKELLSKYQEQARTLEVNNYALTMFLQRARQSSSIPDRFHPDVF